ncbi:MAG: LysR family transcriptional regulator substrate-binding protein, partial [Oscillospiraceae bacterium]
TYIAKYPNVKLHLRESITKELEIVLHKGEVDLCIGFSPNDRTDVETVHLCNEKVFLLIPENLMDNWFKSDADAVRDHLRTTGDVHLVEDLPFLMMDSSSHTGTLTRNMFLEQGITPNVSLVSRDMETLMTLCAQGLGMLFCPSIFVVEALQNKESGFADNVGVYPLKYEGFVREISISYLKNRYLPKAAKEFIRLTQECLKSEHFSHSLF